MRTNRIYVLAAACGAVLTWGAATAQQPASLPKVAPPNRFDYHDDHDGRRLADIRLHLVERDGQRSLELVISAIGPQVEPIPGWRGVRGANRHTAEQIENILTGRFSFVVKTEAEGAAPWFGRWREGRRGTIPERRLVDGRIDCEAVTPRAYPLELIVETGGVREGKQTTELWFDGVPRLRVSYVIAGNEARIVGFASLGKTGAVLSQDAAANQPAKAEPFEFPVADADWNARDLEGKWMLFKKTIGANFKATRPFIGALGPRKEYELLEMIALNQDLFDGGITAAWTLAQADAPQWLRVAAWLRQTEGVSHGEAETSKMLLKHNPGKALAWLSKYADQATITVWEKENPRLAGQYNPLLGAMLSLKRKKIKPAELANALPPLEPINVFRHLDAPTELTVFGARLRAEPGVVYVHQVLRAIHGFEQSGKFRQPWIGKVRRLTVNPHPEVRQAALLAFTHFGDALDAADSPSNEFRRMMDDPKEPAAIREAALMAFSYCRHPQVFVRLHSLLDEPGHPAWAAAVSRLNDFGNEFTLEQFDRIAKAKIPAQHAESFDRYHQALRQWAENPQRNRDLSERAVQKWLERAAWAEQTKSPLAKTLTPWTKAQFVRIDDKIEAFLVELHSSYTPKFALADAPAFNRQFRGLVEDILLTAKVEKK
jgi:hypothetical protein